MHEQSQHPTDPPHPLSMLRGEFVWNGKYDERGLKRMPDPSQLAESAREFERFGSIGTGPQGTLIHGNNSSVMSNLLDRYRGAIDLIYMDPPFDVGSQFHVSTGSRATASDIVAYDDRWGNDMDSYACALHERLVLARELLSEEGSIYLHCDWHCNWIVRAILNEVFGPGQFRNEIAWCYTSPGRNTSRFKPCHDTIFYYARSGKPIWNRPQQELAAATLQVSELKFAGQQATWKRTRTTKDMVDWWTIPFPTGSSERTGYPTQKPRELMRRIIEASSRPGSIVADFYCGSGSFAVAAHELGRSWIACDAGAPAIAIARCRVRDIAALGGSVGLQRLPSAIVDTPRSAGEPVIAAMDTSGEHVVIELVGGADDSAIRAWSVGAIANDGVFEGTWHASRNRRTGALTCTVQLPVGDDLEQWHARIIHHDGLMIDHKVRINTRLRARIAAE